MTTREVYEASFGKFCEDIVKDRILPQNGITYLTDLFKLFVETVMAVNGVDSSNYNPSRQTARLKKRLPQLIFHTCRGSNKGEIVLGEKVEKMNVDEDDIQHEIKPCRCKRKCTAEFVFCSYRDKIFGGERYWTKS